MSETKRTTKTTDGNTRGWDSRTNTAENKIARILQARGINAYAEYGVGIELTDGNVLAMGREGSTEDGWGSCLLNPEGEILKEYELFGIPSDCEDTDLLVSRFMEVYATL